MDAALFYFPEGQAHPAGETLQSVIYSLIHIRRTALPAFSFLLGDLHHSYYTNKSCIF